MVATPTDVTTVPSCRPPDDGPTGARAARSRAALLAAATEILVEAGPRAVTVDAVAERSGVAKSTLYRHWPSRTELLIAVVRDAVPDVALPDLSGGFEAALRELLHRVTTTLASPEWARIMPALVSLQFQVPALAELLRADHETKIAELATVLRLGVDEGRLPADVDPHLTAELLLGPLVFASLRGDVASMPALADHVVDRFLASYRAAADDQPRRRR